MLSECHVFAARHHEIRLSPWMSEVRGIHALNCSYSTLVNLRIRLDCCSIKCFYIVTCHLKLLMFHMCMFDFKLHLLWWCTVYRWNVLFDVCVWTFSHAFKDSSLLHKILRHEIWWYCIAFNTRRFCCVLASVLVGKM